MTSKERVIAAINHRQLDRLPMDLGSTNCTTMTRVAYNNLKKLLGVEKPDVLVQEDFQVSVIDEEVLETLAIDTRAVFGLTYRFPREIVDERTYYDHFRKKFHMAENAYYYSMVENPLANMESVEEMKDSFEWPDPYDPKTIEGIKGKAKKLFEENKYAIVGDIVDTGIFEPSWYLRGMDNFLVDIMINEDIAHYILENMLKFQKGRYEYFLNEVGEYLDIVFVGDDLATAQTTIMSADTYREMVKPYMKDYFSFIKSKTQAKLMYHSCGNILPFIDDLIEIGVDILNPVQVSVKDMDTKILKEKYGDSICFWGAIDTHHVLPNGTKAEVEAEVRKRIDELGPTGYVICPVHDVQPDVPAENILTMYKYALEYMK